MSDGLGEAGGDAAGAAAVERLRRSRPRDRVVRASFWGALGLAAAAWIAGFARGDFDLGDLLSERRRENLSRFFDEALPYPVQTGEGGLGAALGWAWEKLLDPGLAAALTTFALATAAIVLAAAGSLLLLPLATRNLATPEPFAAGGRPPAEGSRLLWAALRGAVRAVLVLARSVPEYIWAFLFLAILGAQAWPAVLALALHNFGILGRLGSEVLENVERPVPAALRGLGAGRAQLFFHALFPAVFTRFLIYFFYRWETCVREATILGLLGFASLGKLVLEARARDHYDEMVFFVLLGALLVFAGDLLSALVRRWLRRAG